MNKTENETGAKVSIFEASEEEDEMALAKMDDSRTFGGGGGGGGSRASVVRSFSRRL